MTPDELKALREKHTYLGDYCGFCTKDGGYPADYPCDVIKVLDATEPDPNCDHVRELGFVPEVGRPYYYRCDCCPKCGEKL